jgi:hypothetical protein
MLHTRSNVLLKYPLALSSNPHLSLSNTLAFNPTKVSHISHVSLYREVPGSVMEATAI